MVGQGCPDGSLLDPINGCVGFVDEFTLTDPEVNSQASTPQSVSADSSAPSPIDSKYALARAKL